MDLERISVTLRPRAPWEAVDLGFALARENFRRLAGAWAALWFPLAAVLAAAFQDNPLWAALILLWLKPVLDRVPLHMLGGAVFGSRPSIRETLRALPSYWNPGLIASLTLYRLDTARSFNLPVWQLERQKGGEARRRAKVLHLRGRGTAVLLTVTCSLLELVVVIGLSGAVDMLTPGRLEAEYGLFSLFQPGRETPEWQVWMSFCFWLVAVALIEPFYVAAGFALYLNRRIELEAWDIELAFRRFAERVAARRSALAALVLAALGVALVALPAGPVEAQAAEGRSAREELAKVLKDPQFDEYEERREWRYRGPGAWWNDNDQEKPRDGKLPNLEWVEWVAQAVRALAWGLAAALIVGAIVYLARYLGLGSSRGRDYQPPAALFGMDLRPESLPDDVAAAAAALVAAGKIAAALSLLYRGALSVLTRRDGVELHPSDTEGDCLRAVRRSRPGETAECFGRIAAAWQAAAYAARLPGAEYALRLCTDWNTHFGSAAATAEPAGAPA